MAEDRITAALRGFTPGPGPADLGSGSGPNMAPQYPPDHQPGMIVPKGGSSCSSCKFLAPSGTECQNQYFIKWNGSPELPAPADEYCSDWYEPAEAEPQDQEGQT